MRHSSSGCPPASCKSGVGPPRISTPAAWSTISAVVFIRANCSTDWRALQKKGVRFFQQTEAQALDFPDHRVTVFCENGAAIQADRVFLANAYARHINGDALERAIFLYDYVVVVELPEK